MAMEGRNLLYTPAAAAPTSQECFSGKTTCFDSSAVVCLSCRCIAECCCGLNTCMAWLLPAACLPVQACTEEKHAFVSKIFKASGISYTNAALPACLQPTMTAEPKTDLHSAQQEAKLVLGQIVGDVLNNTGEGQCCLMVPARAVSCQPTNLLAGWFLRDASSDVQLAKHPVAV